MIKYLLLTACCTTFISSISLASTACTYHKDFNSYTCEQSTLEHPKVFFCPKDTTQRKIIEGNKHIKPSLHCTNHNGKTQFFSCKHKDDSILLLRHAKHHDGSSQPGYICLHNNTFSH